MKRIKEMYVFHQKKFKNTVKYFYDSPLQQVRKQE